MKPLIRDKILSLRRSLSENDILEKSMKIKERLFNLPEFINSNTILFYVSIKDEVKTDFMIKEALKLKKRVAVPLSNVKEKNLIVSELNDFDELHVGSFGILEPKKEFLRPLKPQELNLVIVPGVAFDERGNRIGYGKGFYDNFLKDLRDGVKTIALAYEIQIVESIPTSTKDISVDKIITEKRIIDCK